MNMPFPTRVTLELTNVCNLRCVFCPRRFMEKERGHMDTPLALRLLDEMGEHLPVTLVPFFRGETLLHPDWDSILGHAKRRGIGPIQLASNAVLLTEERARRLIDLNIDFLSFSMDTLDPERYKNLRGADYEESLDNVLRFLSLRARSRCSTQVQVSAVETAAGSAEMENFVAFWRPKADRVRIYREHSAGGTPGSLANPPLPRSERKACHKVSEDMVIYWNGDAALCNHDWTRRVTGQFIANVSEGGIAAAWQSEAYRHIRKAHETGRLAGIAPCEGCDFWSVRHTPADVWGRTAE